MEQKTEQIQKLTEYLIEKYGVENIIVTDYWNADNTAIGLADRTKQYTVYISVYGKKDQHFYVSLENPPISKEFVYSQGEEFNNLTIDEVEKILVKHLHI